MIHPSVKFKLNPIIKLLIGSSLVVQAAVGLLAPIFAIFIENKIVDADAVVVAGVASSILLFTRSLFQIPVARIIDSIKGERDDFYFLFWGMVISSILPIGYIFMHTSYQLFIIQFLLGIFGAFTYPSFMSLFTRHVDKNEEGTEWGIYFTFVDMITSATSALGAVFASLYGFNVLILITVFIGFAGSLLLLPIRRYIK